MTLKIKEIVITNPLRIINISFFFFLEKNIITILIPKRIYISNIFSTTNDIIKRAKIIIPNIKILPDNPSLYKTKINAAYTNAVPRSFCKTTSRKGNIIINLEMEQNIQLKEKMVNLYINGLEKEFILNGNL